MRKLFLKLYFKMFITMLLLAAIGVLAFSMLSQRQQLHYLQQKTLIVVEQVQEYFQQKYQEQTLNDALLSNELLVLQQSTSMTLTPIIESQPDRTSLLISPSNAITASFNLLKNTQSTGVHWHFHYNQDLWLSQISWLMASQYQFQTFDSEFTRMDWADAFAFNNQINFSLIPFDTERLTEHQVSQLLLGMPVIISSNQGNQPIKLIRRLDNNWMLSIHSPLYYAEQSIEILLYTLAIVMLVGMFVCILFIRPIEHKIARLLKNLDKFETIKDESPLPIQLEMNNKPEDEIEQINVKVSQMMRRMHQLAKDQQEMTRAVSHEFRTPIVKMGYHVELLEDVVPSDDFSILGLKQNMKELHSLVDELLLYASMEQAGELRFEAFAIQPAIESLIKQLGSINESKIHLKMSEPLMIKAHEVYFVRALQNLITNAQRYANTQINIYVEQVGGHIHVTVEDDGPGLTLEQKKSVFEPFKVLEQSRNKKLAGHGLGLAIVKRIVLFHGGKAFVDNPKQLSGASFVMVYPKRAI